MDIPSFPGSPATLAGEGTVDDEDGVGMGGAGGVGGDGDVDGGMGMGMGGWGWGWGGGVGEDTVRATRAGGRAHAHPVLLVFRAAAIPGAQRIGRRRAVHWGK